MERTKPFFVCGYPKSGTTFLQRLLNLHPQISCPSEQMLGLLQEPLDAVLAHYANVLLDVDRRTGGQGAPDMSPAVRRGVFVAVIQALSEGFAKGKPIHGLNDNQIFASFQAMDDLLGRPKIIAIVRDPVDVAVSLWRHNRRQARKDPHNATALLKTLDNPKGTVEGFVEQSVMQQREVARRFIAYAAERPNFLVVRYEDLVARKEEQVVRLLAFLGADASREALAAMIEGSSKEAMAKASAWPEFFGLGADREPPVHISDQMRAGLKKQWLTLEMASLGYGSDGQIPAAKLAKGRA